MRKFSARNRNRIIEHLEADIRSEDNGCRVWHGAIDEQGYGSEQFEGRSWRVHELVFQIFRGDPPERMVFRQRCGNKACCNLMHLALVSPYYDSVYVHATTVVGGIKLFQRVED
jgi:HNH endonuclease